jgi:hypothetical protein
MRQECVPLDVEEVRAFWVGDGLLITAHGYLDEPCWEPRIEESPLSVWPPEFVLTRCRTAELCPQVITPFHVDEQFPLGVRPDTIGVYDRAGKRSVEVEDIPTSELFALAEGDDGDFEEAVGLSATFSLEGAFKDALEKLPKWTPRHPDEMHAVVVTQVGAWFGGIAGFHHLYVRIRRRRPGD